MESKRFLQQESSKVVEIEQKKIAESHQVTPSHTKSHPPHSSCCSTLVLLRSHKRLDFTCIHNYLNQSAVVFVCYSFSSSSEARKCDYHSPLLLVFLVEFVCLSFRFYLSQLSNRVLWVLSLHKLLSFVFLQNQQPSVLLVFTSTNYFSWHLCVPYKAAKD